MWIVLTECMERLKTFNISISNGNTESFNGKFTANFFSDRAFYVTIAAADIESQVSPYIILKVLRPRVLV